MNEDRVAEGKEPAVFLSKMNPDRYEKLHEDYGKLNDSELVYSRSYVDIF